MPDLESLKAEKERLEAAFQAVQAELIQQTGTPDQREYKARLESLGLLEEYNQIIAQLKKLKPTPAISANQLRKERGQTYVIHRPPEI